MTDDDIALLDTLGFVPSVLVKGQWTKMDKGWQSAKLERTASGSWMLRTWVHVEGTTAVTTPKTAPFKSDTVGPLLTWAHVEGLI